MNIQNTKSTKQNAKTEIERLIENFDNHITDYKRGKYNETQTRNDYINPFFEALGWDINNRQGLAESYREVIHEDKIKVSGSTKAPDYCFTVYGQKKFFVEAKKPSISIKDNIDPAYQLRRYGWSAKLPISLITDFEEFSVYECMNRPNPTDRASIARIKYLDYKLYLKEFDFFWDVFSKEAVTNGNFDKYIQKEKTREKESVDSEFLKSLDGWRNILAKEIVNSNKSIGEDELNFSLQKVMDRLIFLRICEDRGVEIEGQLKNSIGNNTYQNLKQIFHTADQKYNSGLFDYKKDVITDNLDINDYTLKTIIEDMYYPQSPYEFSVMPVEILGHSYEQYLGKVIKISDDHVISIEEKPEVRKAGGVYYTPQYIVDYIVKNTVGKLVEDKTPDDIAKLKICDPACGSGSFLLGAYQYLLNWHLEYYMNADMKKKEKFLTPDGYLTTSLKKQILLNNIYGVDIDTNAVEVTKLSLMLKAMEGETTASINNQLSLLHDRVLPTLDNNIKSGNSLIDLDFYENQLDFETTMEKKIKPFNWQNAFPEVFKQGGFDAVIGNPPYIRIQTMTEYLPPSVISYYKTKFYSGQAGNIDIYVVFIEKAYNLLSKNGLLGFIQPHKFFQSDFGVSLRDYLAEKKAIDRIVHFGAAQIFDSATTYTCLLFLNKLHEGDFDFLQVNDPKEWQADIKSFKTFKVKQPIKGAKWNFTDNAKQALLDKLNAMPLKLKDITRKIFQGVATSADKIFVLKIIEELENTYRCFSVVLDKEIEIEKGLVKPFLMGKDVKRYENMKPKNVVIFPYLLIESKAQLMTKEYIQSYFPIGWAYILENKKSLEDREKGKFCSTWWQFSRPQNMHEFNQTKLLTPEISFGCNMTLDEFGVLYHTTKVYSFVFKEQIQTDFKYYLGIFNSKLLWYFLKSTGYVLRGGYFTFKTQYLQPFPIPQTPDPSHQSQLIKLVETMLQLNKDLQSATLPEQKEQLKARIDYTDKKIDKLVYELYNLTDDEIKIVEGE